MTVRLSPWTTDELADLLKRSRNHTTEALVDFTATARSVLLARPTALAPSGRADRVAARAAAFLRTGGLLAIGDPEGLRAYLRKLAEDG